MSGSVTGRSSSGTGLSSPSSVKMMGNGSPQYR